MVVHFADPVMQHCLYGFLLSLGIQFIDGRSQSSSLIERPKEYITYLWFSPSLLWSVQWQERCYYCYNNCLCLPLITSIGCTTSCRLKQYFVCQYGNIFVIYSRHWFCFIGVQTTDVVVTLTGLLKLSYVSKLRTSQSLPTLTENQCLPVLVLFIFLLSPPRHPQEL